MSTLIIRQFGLQAYTPVFDAMRQFTDARAANREQVVDELWLLQHPPVFTQGQAGKAEHILAAGDIPVVNIDRGGQVTYHGPGQLVGYLLLDLRRKGINVRALVSGIENTLVAVLRDLGVNTAARKGAPGVYVDSGKGAKIAALGLRIRHGCSYHGFSLNVDMELEPFARINPCGYEGLAVTSIAEQLNSRVDISELVPLVLEKLKTQLAYDVIEQTEADFPKR